ncbi:putative secreted glycosyl hydrolase [Lysobacter antibioticus]|uniref:3-keto-disaccharide hydrolase n=1 Tax=Lysobacter antibioticus TaxID=84531 RepID=UPI000716F279|nr:DUF1080 domain-containing protein [Lysobacter antibioticus]ALN63561.1 putative secreted glycosyl hydrolase [Lysobacter antibioticus]
MQHRALFGSTFLACISLAAAAPAATATAGDITAAAPAAATPRSARGFQPLFDGHSLKGWHLYGQRGKPVAGWRVVDGAIVRSGPGGDLVSDRVYRDFELRIEWKIAPGGNSGIFYRAAETQAPIYRSAIEYQVLDDQRHPDASNGRKRWASAVYDLYPPAEHVARPAGEWNQARIRVRGAEVEHWLNGVKVVAYRLGSADWNARLAQSKFKDWPEFAASRSGAIGLQDHGDEVAYRNILIRPL